MIRIFINLLIVALTLMIAPIPSYSIPTLHPCVIASARLHNSGDFFPDCSLHTTGTHKFDLCWSGLGAVSKPPNSPDYSINAARTFDVHQDWSPIHPSEVAKLEVLVSGEGPNRRVRFTGNWHEYQGLARFKYRIENRDTGAVYLNHGEPSNEGQNCQLDGLCQKTWQTPPGQLTAAGSSPIIAGMYLERVRSTAPDAVIDSLDQWSYAVCQSGCSLQCRPIANPLVVGALLLPLLLRCKRRLLLSVVCATLSLPLTAQGGEPARQLPTLIVDTPSGDRDSFSAVPGLFVTQGEPIDGGCRIRDGVRGIIGRETDDSLILEWDEECTLRVGQVPDPPPDLQPAPAPPRTDTGGAAGLSGNRCVREIMNRTTVQLRLTAAIDAMLGYPVFFDYTRLTRTQEQFRAIDLGAGGGLICWGFEHFASSISFMGWNVLPNQSSYPDWMADWNGANPMGLNHIIWGLNDMEHRPLTGHCAASRISSFDFTGSIWIEDLEPGYRHAIASVCAMGPEGWWQCGHILSPDSVLPAKHVKIWPAGSFMIPSVSMPYFVSMTWQGIHAIGNDPEAPGTVCPAAWSNQPPYVWQTF